MYRPWQSTSSLHLVSHRSVSMLTSASLSQQPSLRRTVMRDLWVPSRQSRSDDVRFVVRCTSTTLTTQSKMAAPLTHSVVSVNHSYTLAVQLSHCEQWLNLILTAIPTSRAEIWSTPVTTEGEEATWRHLILNSTCFSTNQTWCLIIKQSSFLVYIQVEILPNTEENQIHRSTVNIPSSTRGGRP